MIIKNDYVKIKGSKEITLKNYIYDFYLELITQAQYKKEVSQFAMIYCYLKFDEPFDSVEDKTPTDFDIYIRETNKYINASENRLEVNYAYFSNMQNVYDVETQTAIDDLSEFYDRKITAIGFGGVYNYEEVIFACIDTSSFSIRFENNILFQRKDIFITDAVATEGYPVNLSPFSNKKILLNTGGGVLTAYDCYPVLYSIGLGNLKGQMANELIIGEDIDVIEESDTSFGFNLRKGLETTKYPSITIYSNNNLYPMPLNVSKEFHPNKKIYPRNGLVPLLSDYKYIIYKYRYYYYQNFEYHFINEYFTINLPNETKGLFEIITKIERSDV